MQHFKGLLTFTFMFICFFSFSNGEICVQPEVSLSQYTTQDATVLTYIAYVAEFSVKCANGAKGFPLYAEIGGKIVPAPRIGGENNYQVSWIEDVKKAKRGDYVVNLYNEDGYVALRKVIRSGEDLSTVSPLSTAVVNYPGAYQGPWVNSEFMAAILSVLVWYLAFSAKSKLLS